MNLKNIRNRHQAGRKPDRLFIEVIGRYDWLFEKLVAFGEEHCRTSHYIIVSSTILKEKYKAFLKQKDSVVVTVADLEKQLAEVQWSDDYDVMLTASHYEKKYGYRYLKDLMQQDRGIWATKVPFAAATWANARDYDDIIVYDKINRGFEVLERVLEGFKPKMLLVRPGWILSNVAISIAEKKGLPCTMPRPARHKSFVTWTLGPYSHSAQLQKYFFELKNAGIKLDACENILAPDGSRQVFANFQTAYKPLRLLRRLVIESYNYSYILIKSIMRRNYQQRPRYLVFLKRFLLEIRTILYLRKSWVNEVSAIDGKKLLFLLPKEPEYTVQSLGRDFCNIHAILAQLAVSLPVGATLLIKEHSRVGYRKLDFYKELSRYSNVRFVNPFMPSRHFLPHCDAAATVAGTIALECCAAGKKCLTFSERMEYKFLPNIVHVSNLYDICSIVDKVLEEPNAADKIAFSDAAATYYLVLEETSFSAPGTRVFEGKQPISAEALQRAWDLLCKNYWFQLTEWDKNDDYANKI